LKRISEMFKANRVSKRRAWASRVHGGSLTTIGAPSTPFSRAGIGALALLSALLGASPLWAQSRPEPIADQLLAAVRQEGLSLGLLVQAVLDPAVDPDDASAPGVSVAAMRILLGGRLDAGFEYFLQANLAGAPSMLDARVGWSRSPSFAVHAGRFKTPFSKELLTFAGSIDFVNRSRVVDALAPGRQAGVQLSGVAKQGVRWTLGGFSGPLNAPVNESLLGVARFEVVSRRPTDDGISWSIAGSGAIGRDAAVAGQALGSTFEGDGSVLGLDARLSFRRLLVAGELIAAEWTPVGTAEADAGGLYITAGWMTGARSQILARWDRYRAPGEAKDDALLLGFNLWPTSVSEVQVNWQAPISGSPSPHKLLVNFQVGF